MEPLEQSPIVIEKLKDPPREKLISTAVSFLKLPQVQASPLKGKQEFLRSKGLTDEEVRISCEIAGAFEHANNNLHGLPDISNSFEIMRQQPQRYWWPVMRDVASVAAIVVGIFFVSQTLYEKYLYKYFSSSRKDKRSVQNSQSDILALTAEVTEKLVFVQSKLSDLDTKLSKLVHIQDNQDLENQLNNKQIEDLRAEVLSLKGLLLNRKQFPPPNSLAGGGTPSIPSWQLKHDSPKSTGSSSRDLDSNKQSSDHSEGSDPEILSKDTGSNGSDSSLEIVSESSLKIAGDSRVEISDSRVGDKSDT